MEFILAVSIFNLAIVLPDENDIDFFIKKLKERCDGVARMELIEDVLSELGVTVKKTARNLRGPE